MQPTRYAPDEPVATAQADGSPGDVVQSNGSNSASVTTFNSAEPSLEYTDEYSDPGPELDEAPFLPANGAVDGAHGAAAESHGDLPLTSHNWVAEAHSQVQRQTVVRVAPYQPGVIPLWSGLLLLALTAGLVILQLATHQLLLALLIALIGGLIATLLSTTRSVAALFGGLLLVTALLVSMGVEIVYLADHLAGGNFTG